MKWPRFLNWPWVAAGVRTLAPIPLTTCAAALALIIWRGGWPVETSEARIQWLGVALVMTILLLGLALGLLSVVRSFNFKAGPVEASVNEDGKTETVTVTDVETKP